MTNQTKENRTKNVTSEIMSLPKMKSPGPVGLSAEFFHTFKEEIIPGLLKVSHEIEWERTLPNSFYESSIGFIPKQDKDISKKENYR
jgi:hypothetical protein